jgi:hypothetical protein
MFLALHAVGLICVCMYECKLRVHVSAFYAKGLISMHEMDEMK